MVLDDKTYTWLKIACSEDWKQLEKAVAAEYNPGGVATTIQDGISGRVKAVLIEHNYVDKDYRSTYYNFYAKKGRRYRSRCVRLHFFDDGIEFDDRVCQFLDLKESLDDFYFGYMVLRPTGICTIGRSVLSPDIRTGAQGLTIWADHKVHLLGYRTKVRGFPSMDQHNDISVCAHAACWSILRHYSERYTMHREFLVHDITLMAQYHDPGSILPSKGLDMTHAERVFQQGGTYPIHMAKADDPDNPDPEEDLRFYRSLTAYIESGIPLFAADHPNKHAFAVIGYSWKPPSKEEKEEEEDPAEEAENRPRHSWDELQSLVVVDDNHLPYLSIPANGTKPADPYRAEDIDAFIVPLPEKVHYPADAVDLMTETLRVWSSTQVQPPVIKLPDREQTVLRYFITTAAGYRRFVHQHVTEFDPNLVNIVMGLPFAQFLWVIEYGTRDDWAKGQIAARAIVDATASIREPMPLWLIHDRQRAVVFDRRDGDFNYGDLELMRLKGMQDTAFSRMEQNLESIGNQQ